MHAEQPSGDDATHLAALVNGERVQAGCDDVLGPAVCSVAERTRSSLLLEPAPGGS